MTGADIIATIILTALAIAIFVYLLHWLYRRSSKEVSFVRTGLRGEKVVISGGAFVLPETAKEKPQQGLVRAAGPGKFDEDGDKRIPMDVAEGDRVLFAKYAGTEVKLDGKKMLIMKESDILGIVEV